MTDIDYRITELQQHVIARGILTLVSSGQPITELEERAIAQLGAMFKPATHA